MDAAKVIEAVQAVEQVVDMNSIILSMVKTAGDIKDLAVQEIPPTLEQLIMWHGIREGLYAALGAFLILFAIALCLLVVKWSNEEGLKDEHGIALLVATASSFASCFTLNLVWLQILIAPRVWLIEYAANLVK